MVQVSLSTTTSFDGDLNALVEDQGNALTFRLDLDEPAPAGGLKVYIDSDIEQIINRLDLPAAVRNPQIENIDLLSTQTNFDNSGIAVQVSAGATFATVTLDIFDNPEPDTFLPETFDGLVEAAFSLLTADQIAPEDQTSISGLDDYTIDPNAASSTVLFADTADQLPGEPEPPTPPADGYDEAISGDISDNPNAPLTLDLSEGTNRLSATSGGGDQEYVTVTVPDGFQLDAINLESFTPNDVAFIGVQEGSTFTEPLDDTADVSEFLGYTLFGTSAVGTDILDNIGNGSNGANFGGQGFEGPLPAGTYTFGLQQLGADSDYTLVFNVGEATVAPPTDPPTDPPTGEPPVVSFEVVPDTFSEEDPNNLVEWKWTVTGDFPEGGITVNMDTSGGETPFAFTDQFAATPEAEFIDSDIVDFDDTGRLNILLTAPEASFKLYFVDDILEEGTQEFNFQLVDGDGYTVDAEINGGPFTITDDNGGPGVGPTIGLTTSGTDLVEGDTFTVTFTAEGDIPADGVQVLVQSDVPGSLGQFDLADLGNITTTGIEGLPTVGDGGGGSFFITMTEPTATITLDVFDDILAEEPLPITFTVANGEEYEVDADNPSITLNITDQEQLAGPTVSLTVDKTDVTEGDTITLSFAVDGEIPEGGLQVLVNDTNSAQNQLRSLTEFDVANVETTGIAEFPSPADGDSGFFVTLTDPTATITLPVLDDGADEDEANESFTFELIDGEAYEVDADASGITLNISDATGGNPPTGGVPVVSLEATPDTISEEGSAEERLLTLTFTVDGEIPEGGLNVLLSGLFGITDQSDGEDDRGAFDGLGLTPPFDRENNLIGIRLDQNVATLQLPMANDLIEETTTFDFQIAEGDGYTINPDQSGTLFTITDDNGGPGVGPTISFSASETNLAEGDALTVNFAVDGEIPEGGLEVLVQSPVAAALGQFELSDLSALQLTGISDVRPGDTRGQSFIATITEANASIGLSIFNDIVSEESLEVPFTLANGELYEVDPAAETVTFTISDDIQSVGPTVGLTVDKTDVTEGESVTLTFSIEGEIPAEGVQVLVNDVASAGSGLRSLTEFEVGGIQTTGITGAPTPAEGDSGFFVTITEPTATLTVPIFDEGADEDEATEVFTFELIDGEAYEIDEAASSFTLNISDATDSGGEGPAVTLDLVSGTFGDEGELVTPNLVESGSGSPILSLLLSADGPVPEDGLVVNVQTDLADLTAFIQGSNFLPTAFGGEVIGALYSEDGLATGLQVRLDNPNTVVNFTTGLTNPSDAADAMPAEINFSLAEGEGYTPVTTPATATLYSDISQVPAVENPPEVGIAFDSDTGTLTEGGDTGTLNFSVDGEIPADGLLVFVSNNQFAGIVDFDLLNATTTGGAFPAPDGSAGGFFFKITEPSASITFQARVDEEVEGLEQVSVALQPLAGYTIDPAASDVSILVQESDDSVVQVSYETSSEVLVETEGTASVHTFNLSAPPPAEGITVTVQTPGLSDFDASAAALTGITGLEVLESAPEQIRFTITEQTATIELPVANDGEAEGSEEAVFTLLEGEGYQVAEAANTGTFTIVETPDDVPPEPITDGRFDALGDTIATATATELSADNSLVSIEAAINGNFFDSSRPLTDSTEDVDMYSVELAAGDVLRLDIDARITRDSDESPDTVLRLFDADGNEVAVSDDDFAPDELFAPGRQDSYIEFTAENAGTYYVGVSSFGNGAFDFFIDDDGNLENDPYDPNVAGSGAGRSDGEYTLNLSLNQAFTAPATEIPDSTGEGPTVSLSATPATYDSDDNLISNALVQYTPERRTASILTLGLDVEGDIPEEGIEAYLTSDVDLSTIFSTRSPFSSEGLDVTGAVYNDAGEPIGLKVNITANSGFINLNLSDPEEEPTDGEETIAFTLEPSAGYTVGDSSFSTVVYDTLDDVPELPTVPTVGISISETELIESEGNTTTVTFTLDSPPPEGGLTVNVDSGIRAALGEFDVFNAEIEGGSFPSPNFQASGFFFTITEQTATMTLAAFDETTNPDIPAEDALEGIDELTFTVQPGVGYAVAPDASDITLTIADNPDSVVIPGEDDGNGESDGEGETPGIPVEEEFNDTIADAIATGLSADNPTYVVTGEIGTTRATRNFVDRSEDVDMYAFELEAGQVLTLDVDAGGTGDAGVEGSLMDSVLRVFDAAGNEVATSDNDGAPDEVFQANGDSYLEFEAPDAGTYYVGISSLGNNFYDPNVQASGSGWIFEDRFEPGEYRLSASLNGITPPPGDAPVISLFIEPDVLSEEDADSTLVSVGFSVDGEVPADGLSILVTGSVDILDQVDGARDIAFNNAVLGEFFDPTTGTFEVVLSANSGSIDLPILNDVIQEADRDFSFTIVENDGSVDSSYAVDPVNNSDAVTLVDGIGGPSVGPAVSISVDNSELVEGDSFTVSFSVDGDIPAEGLTVRVNSSVARSLGEFNIFDADGNPAVTFEGIAGFPVVGDSQGGSFLVTLTEPTASLTLSVFEDGPTEGLETIDFEIIDGEIYEVNPDASSITLNINDGGEDAVFAATSGITSVFLDFPLLEEVAGLTLVGADSDATPFSEDFQVGFAITDETDFTFAPAPFTPLGGAIEHSGTITLGLGGAEATIGEFTIGFDPSRVSDTASGFFVADTLEDPLGLEVLFDISAPGTLNVGSGELEISNADLLLAPELATALGLADLAGADVGDARVDALVTLEDGVTPGTPIEGTNGRDRLFGTDGNDIINALAGRDSVKAGDGDDTINGGSGNDRLFGEAGDDTINGDSGQDALFGGDGNDTLDGGSGQDRMFGNAGDDILTGGSGPDRMYGGTGQDILAGGTNRDRIFGNEDRDILIGDAGDDFLSGGEGNDVLMGVTGHDVLVGGSGDDLFVFGTGDGTDRVRDFEVGSDKIGLVEGELTFADLTITQRGSRTLLGVADSGETLAILQNVDASSLSESSFEIVPNVATVEDALTIL